MKRYFFCVRHDGGTIPDEEGDEFAALDDARLSALTAIRELVAARIKNGLTIPDDHLDICDETGTVALSISFHEVVEQHLAR